MRVRRSIVLAGVVAWLVAGIAGRAIAAPPAEQILPTNTVLFVSFPDFPTLKDKWAQTQVGKFVNDPAMTEFVQHFKDRVRERLESGPAGLTIDEAAELPSGETTLAVSRDAAGKSVEWAIVSVAGQKEKVAGVLDKIKTRVTKENGKSRTVKAGDVVVTVYDIPLKTGANPSLQVERLAHFERDEMLVFCTHEGAAVEAATVWNTKPAAAIAGSATYKAVIGRLDKDAANGPGQGKPDFFLFVRPMAYAETVRADFPRKAPPGEVDLLVVMRNQQFHKIFGIGASGHFVQGDYDAVVRAAAYAPDVHLATNSLRMLTFINSPAREAQAWLPAGVGTYIDLTWNTAVAFDGFGSFFDEYMEEKGAWQDLIDSVRDDPNGPGIDLKKDLISLLSGRVSIVSRFILPSGLDSRQKLVVAETSNQDALAKNIDASLRNDPKVKVVPFEGTTLYEIHDQQPPPAPGAGQKAVKIPPTAIAVANGALLIATHVDLMKAVLQKQNADGVAAKNYAAALAELQKMYPGDYCLSGWFDAGKNVEPTFELMRAGKLANDHSLIGELLRRMAEDNKKNLKLDGKLLPAFNQVSQYFTGGGYAVRFEQGYGWFGRAYVLKTGAGPAAAPAAPAGETPATPVPAAAPETPAAAPATPAAPESK